MLRSKYDKNSKHDPRKGVEMLEQSRALKEDFGFTSSLKTVEDAERYDLLEAKLGETAMARMTTTQPGMILATQRMIKLEQESFRLTGSVIRAERKAENAKLAAEKRKEKRSEAAALKALEPKKKRAGAKAKAVVSKETVSSDEDEDEEVEIVAVVRSKKGKEKAVPESESGDDEGKYIPV